MTLNLRAKKISFNEKTHLTILENVSLKSGKFQFENAGKVIYDQKAKKISVYDCKDFTIQGKIVTGIGTAKKNIVNIVSRTTQHTSCNSDYIAMLVTE